MPPGMEVLTLAFRVDLICVEETLLDLINVKTRKTRLERVVAKEEDVDGWREGVAPTEGETAQRGTRLVERISEQGLQSIVEGDIVTKGSAKIFIWRASGSGTAGGHKNLAEPSESLSSTVVPRIQGSQERQTQALQETGGCTAGDMRPTRSIWRSALSGEVPVKKNLVHRLEANEVTPVSYHVVPALCCDTGMPSVSF